MNANFIIGDPRVFVGVTMILGGLASFAAGRAVALTWRPLGLLALYGLPLAFAMRFLHWSLFGEPLAAPFAAMVAYGWSLAVQGLAWRVTHGALARRQYPWLH
ncbi:DUF6867 family protein [Rhodoblastus sp.]|uniref:DUF6867 family protein n=1 Tax=Rhodoblastus sp. TaxID=1962975 RepID=UPI002605942A|nr:hypothetical protein [Rhodoblastus sp.]